MKVESMRCVLCRVEVVRRGSMRRSWRIYGRHCYEARPNTALAPGFGHSGAWLRSSGACMASSSGKRRSGAFPGALGFSAQKPERRAIERDEEAVRHWKRHTWPALKKKPSAKAG